MPKPLREALGLRPGQELEATVREGHLEIAPAPVRLRLELQDGGLVAVPGQEMATLNADTVRDVLEHVRR